MTLSRVLSWTFKNYRSITLATLTGFMIGSLNKIWPWRVPTEFLRDTAGAIVMKDDGITPKKIIMEDNVLPTAYETATQNSSFLMLAILFMIIGFVSVFLLEKLGSNKEEN